MTKKKIILIIGIVISPVILLIVARLLSWYTFYTVPTTSMLPTVKANQRLFASSLLSVNRNDIVSYNATPTIYEQVTEKYLAVGRVVGIENDVIEIRNGTLFVNSEMEKDTMNRAYFFLIRKDSLPSALSDYSARNNVIEYSDSIVTLNFSYNELLEYRVLKKCTRIFDNNTDFINTSWFGPEYAYKKWSTDNFGPLKVPAGKLFLLGDNRSNSADSRVRGFTDVDDVVAKVIQ